MLYAECTRFRSPASACTICKQFAVTVAPAHFDFIFEMILWLRIIHFRIRNRWLLVTHTRIHFPYFQLRCLLELQHHVLGVVLLVYLFGHSCHFLPFSIARRYIYCIHICEMADDSTCSLIHGMTTTTAMQ